MFSPIVPYAVRNCDAESKPPHDYSKEMISLRRIVEVLCDSPDPDEIDANRFLSYPEEEYERTEDLAGDLLYQPFGLDNTMHSIIPLNCVMPTKGNSNEENKTDSCGISDSKQKVPWGTGPNRMLKRKVVDKIFETFDDPYADFPYSFQQASKPTFIDMQASTEDSLTFPDSPEANGTALQTSPVPTVTALEASTEPASTPLSASLDHELDLSCDDENDWDDGDDDDEKYKEMKAYMLEDQLQFCLHLMNAGINPSRHVSYESRSKWESIKKVNFKFSTPKEYSSPPVFNSPDSLCNSPDGNHSDIDSPMSGIVYLGDCNESSTTPTPVALRCTPRSSSDHENIFADDIPPELKKIILQEMKFKKQECHPHQNS